MNELVLKNPITNTVKDSINKSNYKLNFASPFLSSFVKIILDEHISKKLIDKKLITRFDDTNINSFDLPTLKFLLDLGFKIKYDNNIHLKLYIIDTEVYITSSNLTKKGFEDNIELTVKVESENTKYCMDVFNEIWENCRDNYITEDLIKANFNKFELLKKIDGLKLKGNVNITIDTIANIELDLEQIIEEIFKQKKDYSELLNLKLEANKLREQTKNKLKQGFNVEIFCVPKGHLLRKTNLLYDLAYGKERKLAGTGLFEFQLEKVFMHPEFNKVVNYIYPEMIGKEPWNFMENSILKKFCIGLFDFDIPEYTEVIPIRLASYFYPDVFLPIFKLEHLKKICESLGLVTNAKTNGEKLFAYSIFIKNKLKTLPYDNFIKMHTCYQIIYTIELYTRLKNNEEYMTILNGYKENWIKNKIEEGMQILNKLKTIT